MIVGTITTRIALLQRWLDRSSVATAPTPLGHQLIVGQWGCVVPVDFAAPPPTGFDVQALPIFVSSEQCEGTGISADDFDPDEPDSQQDIADRLEHFLFKIGSGELPALCVVGLERADEPISAAVERAAFGPVAMEAPTIALPLYGLADGPRQRLAAALPLHPALNSIDPAIDNEAAPESHAVRDLWP